MGSSGLGMECISSGEGRTQRPGRACSEVLQPAGHSRFSSPDSAISISYVC
jgi:hypothetical protein